MASSEVIRPAKDHPLVVICPGPPVWWRDFDMDSELPTPTAILGYVISDGIWMWKRDGGSTSELKDAAIYDTRGEAEAILSPKETRDRVMSLAVYLEEDAR